MIMVPKIFRASDDTAGMAGGISDQVFIIAEGDVLQLPEGFDPAAARYARAGPDLMLTSADGSEIVIADFFMSETPPALAGYNGSRISGTLAARLAGPLAPGQGAGEGVSSEAMGRISALTGTVTVIRADGRVITLHAGDSLFPGDIVDTSADAGVGLLLADGTALSMAADSRMVLDDMVYDPGTPGGSLSLSVLRGVFTIVSGEISKSAPDAMQVQTPTALLNIHGTTQVGLDLNGEQGLTVVMMEEADGLVGEISLANDGGTMPLDQAYFALATDAFNTAPTSVQSFAHDMLLQTFGVTFAFLPVDGTNANDYGLQASMAEGLAGFDPLSGTDVSGTDEAVFDTSAGDGQGTIASGGDVLVSDAGDTIPPSEGISGFEALAMDALPIIDTAPPDVTTFATDAGGVPALAPAPADLMFGAEIAPAAVMEDILAVALGEVNVALPPPSAPPPLAPPSPSPLTVQPEAVVAPPSVEAPAIAPAVAPANAPPVAQPGTVLTAEDHVFSGQLSATDRDGDALTFDVVEGGEPAHGAVSISSNGIFSYTPDSDFGGADTFTYQVTDDAGEISTATVSVTVTPGLDVPVLAVTSAAGDADAGVTLAIAAAMPAGTQETITSITLSGVPSGASLNAGTDNGDGRWDVAPDDLNGLVLTPPEDYSGTLDLRVTAVSSDGGVATEDFSATVAVEAPGPTLTVSEVVIQAAPDVSENAPHEEALAGGYDNNEGIDHNGDGGSSENTGDDPFVFRAGDGTDITLDLGEHEELRFEGSEFSAEDFTLQANGDEGATITFGADAGVSVTLNDVAMDATGEGYSVTQDGNAVVVAFHATDSGH